MKVYLLNRVENIATKGELAHYEQFFFILSQCFQKSPAIEVSKCVCMREIYYYSVRSVVMSKIRIQWCAV